MIRDFSAESIEAGCTKANLRQDVEARVEELCREERAQVREMRMREVGTGELDEATLHLDEVGYDTTNTHEAFLQWVDAKGTLAGFLRLSLPHPDYVHAHSDELPIGPSEAMIREVHVYGRAAQLDETNGTHAQHTGLGRALVERACEIAAEKGHARINVISAVGTREYYRNLGFEDGALYQSKEL